MEWLSAVLASKSAQAGFAGTAGGVSAAWVKRLPIKSVVSGGVLGGGFTYYLGVDVSQIMGIDDHSDAISYILGTMSSGLLFGSVTAISSIDWKLIGKAIQSAIVNRITKR